MTKRLRRDERGSMTLELVIVTPILVTLLMFMVGLGRISHAREQVNIAAREAARSASFERTPAAAKAAGAAAANAQLDGAGLSCQTKTVQVDVSEHHAGGRDVAVVTCVASMVNLGRANLGPSKTVTAKAVVPLERFRSRS